MKYADYILSKEWASLRRRCKEADRHACRVCGTKNELDVHHKTYERLGHEELGDLITLCRRCHRDHHYFQGRTVATPEMVKRTIPITQKEYERAKAGGAK